MLEDSSDESSEEEAPSMPEVNDEVEKVVKDLCELPWSNHDGTPVTEE